uniref:Ig-like domain-containing protein n=1 Tax=Strigamia maritima TaxID=126957 RepID=T1IVE3_STRMM
MNAVRAVIYLSAMLLITAMICEAARGGGRGKTRTRFKQNQPGNTLSDNMKFDHNSRLEYYNNPKGARITKASHFDYEYILGHKIIFICESKGTPRPHVTWFKDTMELYAHPYLQIHEWKIGNDKIKSKMEIDPAAQMDAGTYECHANNKYSIDRRTFKADFSITE